MHKNCFSCLKSTDNQQNARSGKRFCDLCKLINQIMSDEFSKGYIECMLWTEAEEIQELGLYDMSMECLKKIISECDLFEEMASDELPSAGDESQNGHDFWLTRNGHGAGFWDRGYAEEISDKLLAHCECFCDLSLVVGDDKQLHLEG